MSMVHSSREFKDLAVLEFKAMLDRDLEITPEVFFDRCDEEGRGEVSVKSFKSLMSELNIVMDQRNLNRLITAFDSGMTGIIKREDYNKSCNQYQEREVDKEEAPFID